MKLTDNILNEARTLVGNISVAAVVLTQPNGDRHITHYVAEYGDGDGVRQMNDFIADCGTEPLYPGERLHVEVREFTFGTGERRP